MFDHVSAKRVKTIRILLVIAAFAKGMAILSMAATFLSIGTAIPNSFEVRIPIALGLVYCGVEAFLMLFAASALSTRRELGGILTAVAAVLMLPSLLFPISVACLWCLTPPEYTQPLVAAIREALQPMRTKDEDSRTSE